MAFRRLLKQQRLPAWQLNFTPWVVSVVFWVVALICIPLGVFVEICNSNATDISYRYDNETTTVCDEQDSTIVDGGAPGAPRICETAVVFDLPSKLEPPVYLYYGLTEMYQNHRRYTNSRSDKQLRGANERSIPDADPFVIPGARVNKTTTPIQFNGKNLYYRDFVYLPAGLVAWSMFNDTFTLYQIHVNSTNRTEVLICNGTDFSRGSNLPLNNSATSNHCRKKGIAWESDVTERYKAPEWSNEKPVWSAPRTEYDKTVSSTNDSFLENGWYVGEEGHLIPVVTDEDFMVWMRPSPLPTLRKLYRVITKELEAGKYKMKIRQNYNTTPFNGEKWFILLKPSILGGVHSYLSATFIGCGTVALLFTVALIAANRLWGHRWEMVEKRLAME